MIPKFLSLLLLAASLVVVINCGRSSSVTTTNDAAANQASAAPSPTPLQVTSADLNKLKWIEGAWKGTGDVEKPFFERYRIEPDAIVVEGFDDETLNKVTDVTRFELKDGQLGNPGDTRWVATGLDEKSITFSPAAKARNTFIWQTESADVWKAILRWPASDKGPARERVYKMERIR